MKVWNKIILSYCYWW